MSKLFEPAKPMEINKPVEPEPELIEVDVTCTAKEEDLQFAYDHLEKIGAEPKMKEVKWHRGEGCRVTRMMPKGWDEPEVSR